MNKTSFLIRKMTGLAILIALSVVLTLISNYIQIGTISINLSLIPVALAGILYGPLAGLFVGIVNGGMVLLAPSTSAFFAIDVFGTIFICLLKSALSGLCAGLIFRLFYKHYFNLGVILASLFTPIINTGIFILGALIFFSGAFGELISIFVSVNFIIEFTSTAILCPTIVILIKNLMKNHSFYFNLEPKEKKKE